MRRERKIKMRICVYGAASPTIDNEYKVLVEKLGKKMVERGHSLVFGGGGHGLMGAAADGVRAAGGHILGVIPKFFETESVEKICDFCDELIMPETMRERKQIMEDNADAFIVVPGGIGTYEEFFEILTSKQLCRHNKPIALYNIRGFYDEMDMAMKSAIKKNFIKEDCRDLYILSDDVDEIFKYVETPVTNNRKLSDLKEG